MIASPKHIKQLAKMAKEMAAEHYPKLRPSDEKIASLVTDCVSGASNYAEIAQDLTSGALLAHVSNNAWAERKNAHILYFQCSTPGEGIKMLRNFRRWVEGRRAIRYAGLHVDIDIDGRVKQLLVRTGFSQSGGSYIFYN